MRRKRGRESVKSREGERERMRRKATQRDKENDQQINSTAEKSEDASDGTGGIGGRGEEGQNRHRARVRNLGGKNSYLWSRGEQRAYSGALFFLCLSSQSDVIAVSVTDARVAAI